MQPRDPPRKSESGSTHEAEQRLSSRLVGGPRCVETKSWKISPYHLDAWRLNASVAADQGQTQVQRCRCDDPVGQVRDFAPRNARHGTGYGLTQDSYDES